MMGTTQTVEAVDYLTADERPLGDVQEEKQVLPQMVEKPIWQWTTQTIEVLVGGPDKALYYALKRLFDVVAAGLLLFLLLPLLVLIATLIKLDSPGPIFFIHNRVGSRRRKFGGQVSWEVQPFPFFKFRSMRADSDESLHQKHIEAYMKGELETDTVDGAKVKIKNDPRITKIGHFIRRTSLDELPQLINVLRGEMSLVGPRPVPLYEAEGYEDWHRARLAAVPGITGYWQVKGRGQVLFEEMINLDLEYVRDASLWLDFKILFLTIPAILSGDGAE
ncbi:MAG: sugar transferase [Chloroflexota bacterium]